VILKALERFGENRTRTAEALGISVRTLQRRLKDWKIA
jgi:transcriptional regulator with PAS, ATPase and Fis domain